MSSKDETHPLRMPPNPGHNTSHQQIALCVKASSTVHAVGGRINGNSVKYRHRRSDPAHRPTAAGDWQWLESLAQQNGLDRS